MTPQTQAEQLARQIGQYTLEQRNVHPLVQELTTLIQKADALDKIAPVASEMAEHLDYCGYGDKWERECAEGLMKKVGEIKPLLSAIEKAQKE